MGRGGGCSQGKGHICFPFFSALHVAWEATPKGREGGGGRWLPPQALLTQGQQWPQVDPWQLVSDAYSPVSLAALTLCSDCGTPVRKQSEKACEAACACPTAAAMVKSCQHST